MHEIALHPPLILYNIFPYEHTTRPPQKGMAPITDHMCVSHIVCHECTGPPSVLHSLTHTLDYISLHPSLFSPTLIQPSTIISGISGVYLKITCLLTAIKSRCVHPWSSLSSSIISIIRCKTANLVTIQLSPSTAIILNCLPVHLLQWSLSLFPLTICLSLIFRNIVSVW